MSFWTVLALALCASLCHTSCAKSNQSPEEMQYLQDTGQLPPPSEGDAVPSEDPPVSAGGLESCTPVVDGGAPRQHPHKRHCKRHHCTRPKCKKEDANE